MAGSKMRICGLYIIAFCAAGWSFTMSDTLFAGLNDTNAGVGRWFAGPVPGRNDAGSVGAGTLFGFKSVDFSAGFDNVMMGVALDDGAAGVAVSPAGYWDFIIDSPTGQAFASIQLLSTGGWGTYLTETAATTTRPTGVHTVYVVGRGNANAVMDWFAFSKNAGTAPTITTQPVSQTVVVGQTATFSVVASGAAPLSYQWKKGGTNITGAIAASYTTPATVIGDNGAQFTCYVSNGGGNVTSSVATLTVSATPTAPSITTQPVSRAVTVGQTATFTVVASGTAPLSYQWKKGGTNITGAIAASYTTPATVIGDNGAQFTCYVSNSIGNITSAIATLTVNVAPTITTQPNSQSVTVGQAATFTVVASGTAPLSYQWRKGGTNIASATAASYATPITVIGDNGSQFTCVVSNAAGSVTSTIATLTVNAAPVAPIITTEPTSQTLLAGQTATFTVAASGTAPLSYEWYRGPIVAGAAIGNLATYGPLVVQAADSGAQFLCVVKNSAGADTSAAAILNVVTRPGAGFSMPDYNVQLGAVATFTDTSTGNIIRWKWDFGVTTVTTDTAVNTARPATATFTYPDTGHYAVKLVVYSPVTGVRDSAFRTVTVFRVGSNPLYFKSAQTVSSTKIAVAIRGVNTINTDPLKAPFCNGKVDIWYGRRGLSLGASPMLDTLLSGRLKEYDLPAMIAKIGTTDSIFRDTLTVAAPTTPADTVYGVWVSPIWNNGMPSLYNGGNAITLFMKPVNTLTVTGNFLGNTGTIAAPVIDAQRIDSATVTLAGIDQIDASTVASIVIGYGFADGQALQSVTIPADSAKAGGAQYVWGIKNAQFAKDTVRVYVSVYQIGINKLMSDAKKSTFIAGWPYPANPSILTITDIEPTRLRVNWTNPGQVDAIRILLSRVQAVPLGQMDEAQVGPDSDDVYQALTPAALTDTTLAITALQHLTKYYVGMQVLKNLHWSDVTVNTRREATTIDFRPEDSVRNTIKIEAASFDPITNGIKVKWHMQPLPNINRDIGVVYSLDPAASRQSPDSAANVKIVSLSEATLSGETSIDLSSSIQFGATYYVSLWLRSSQGPWAAWTDTSVCSVVVDSQYTWQRISYFGAANTPVTMFNGTVLLRKDSLTLSVSVTDTVTFYAAPVLPAGMSDMGVGASFKKDNGSPLWIGFHYTTLPAAGAGSLGIYRVNAQGQLLAEYDIQLDGGNQIVWARVDRYSFQDAAKNNIPFLLLSDAQKPDVTFLSDTSKALLEEDSLSDTIRIADNIANVQWRLYYAKDGDAFQKTPPSGSSGYACGVCPGGDTVVTHASTWYVTEDNGIRARLIVSDAVHVDTIDVSRSGIRLQTDAASPGPAGWAPVAATARLADTTAQVALRQLAGTSGWVYDSTEFRLFRWYETAANKLATAQWLEYSAARADIFAFAPGRVMWLKTREQKVIDLGQATTMSLKRPVAIALPPAQWLDLRLPYKFEIRIGDILQASGLSKDSVDIYRWEEDPTGLWVAKEFCLARSPLNFDSTDMPMSPDNVYTIYNSATRAVSLLVPPAPVSMSTYQKAVAPVTKRGIEGWSLRLASRVAGGAALNAVYCGYVKGTGAASYYPLPPSFGSVSVGVADRAAGRLYGQGVAHTASSSWEIAYVNRSARPVTVASRVERLANMPDVPVRIYDAGTGQWTSAEGDITVTIGAGATVYRSVAIGENAFAGAMVLPGHFGLAGVLSDRTQGIVRIRYEAPGSGAAQVRFTIHDLSGRLVWRRTVPGTRVSGGMNTVSWMAGGTPAIYVLTMEAVGSDGKPAGRYQTVFANLR
jgi:hypothetical protein